MINLINKRIQKYAIKNFKKNEWSPLKKDLENVFQEDGFYVCNLKNQDNFFSKLIGFFQKGFSHTVLLYKGDVKNYLDLGQINALQSKYIFYYKDSPDFLKTKVYVWGSANINGINWFDFSKYQGRGLAIYKLPFLIKNENNVRKIMLNSLEYLYKPYDATGLVGWLFYKYISKLFNFFDDQKSPFCSEYCYEIIKKNTGEIIASKNNPGPGDIHDFIKNFTIYEQ